MTVNLTNPLYKEIVEVLPYKTTLNGDKLEVEWTSRITENGIQDIFPDGNLTLVEYDAKMGDTYTAKINGSTIKRTETKKSKTDDDPYAFFNIKVLEVQQTVLKIPGVYDVYFYANHSFGLLGLKLLFENGSEKKPICLVNINASVTPLSMMCYVFFFKIYP